jgi:hypothetical protein
MHAFTTSAVALGTALLLGLAGASPSFAKAHDNGRTQNGGVQRGPAGDTALSFDTTGTARNAGDVVSGLVSDGARGAARSGLDKGAATHDRSNEAHEVNGGRAHEMR